MTSLAEKKRRIAESLRAAAAEFDRAADLEQHSDCLAEISDQTLTAWAALHGCLTWMGLCVETRRPAERLPLPDPARQRGTPGTPSHFEYAE